MAWNGIHLGNVKLGQRVLVHAAAGGIGSLALQFAKSKGAYVIGTASEHNFDFLKQLGADEVIDYKNKDFVSRLDNIDVVFDASPVRDEDARMNMAATLKESGIFVTVQIAFPFSIEFLEVLAKKNAEGKMIRRELNIKQSQGKESMSWCYDFYCIGLKRVSLSPNIKFKYGQQPFDFDEGIMSFVAPNQLLSLSIDTEEEQIKHSGWILLIHPECLWNTPLAKTIKKYDFWNYTVHESLFLSSKEETIVINIFQNIQREYHANIDRFSKQIIIS